MNHAMKKYSVKKVFVSGLSLGGGVAFQMAVRNPEKIKGAVLLSPGFKDNPLHMPYAKKLVMIFGLFLPPFQIPRFGVKHSKQLNLYREKDDLLYKGKFWLSTTYESLIFMRENRKLWDKFTSPYLLIQAGQDKVLNPFQCLDF